MLLLTALAPLSQYKTVFCSQFDTFFLWLSDKKSAIHGLSSDENKIQSSSARGVNSEASQRNHILCLEPFYINQGLKKKKLVFSVKAVNIFRETDFSSQIV